MTDAQLNASLDTAFKKRINDEITKLQLLWQRVLQDKKNTDLTELCYKTLRIAESSKSRHEMTIWELSNGLSLLFNQLLNDKETDKIDHAEIVPEVEALFVALKAEISQWHKRSSFEHSPVGKQPVRTSIIYLVGESTFFDPRLIFELKRHLSVETFSTLALFKHACKVTLPSAIIAATCIDKTNDSAESIMQLQQSFTDFPPVIFISDKHDFNIKLAVARAKGRRLFQKPVDIVNLVQATKGIINNQLTQDIKVLFVDDDKSISDYHISLAQDFGLDSRALLNPENILIELVNFKPDVIVLDIYMPNCSGLELAQIIRQDSTWAFIPIIFLSQETSDKKHLEALDLGGDDFYTKPIEPEPFFAAIISKTKRSRWVNRLTNELKDTELESENQLMTMNQHNLVSVTDISGNIIDVNDNFCQISGYTRAELIGKNHRMIKSNYHPSDFYKNLWQTISAGKTWQGQICNKSKSGQDYWVESTIVPFKGANNQIYKYVSIRTDITKLKLSEARYSSSQLFANIGTWELNLSSDSIYLSENIAEMYGYPKGSIETTYRHFISNIHPDDRKKVEQAVKEHLLGKSDFEIEHRVIWPDQSVHWVKESGNVTYNDNKEAQHMLGVVQGLDSQKKIEKDLELAKSDAEQANKAKSEFLSRMSHELRTPLNAIMGFNQLLQIDDNPLTPEQEDHLHEISKASEHLLMLINEILDLAKIEAGRIDLSIEDVHIFQVLKDAIKLITPLAVKNNIEITFYIEGKFINEEELSVNKAIVQADITRLKQVLINLMSNAVKYNKVNGKLIIKGSLMHDKNMYRIEIQDTGAGLSLMQQEKLFEPFTRFNVADNDIEGTGIGLVITKKLIELMMGNIGFTSQEDKGSTFWIEIPATANPIQSPLQLSEAIMVTPPVNETMKNKKKVLYIEDNPANLRLVTQILSHRSNIETITAHEPMLGLELAAEHIPDLILLDINLPGISGFEVLKHLKQRENIAQVPVIAISANAMPKDIEKGLNAGFINYITKPIDIKLFLQIIDEILM